MVQEERLTYAWRAPSGVLVTSCVPRDDTSWWRALLATYAHYLFRRSA